MMPEDDIISEEGVEGAKGLQIDYVYEDGEDYYVRRQGGWRYDYEQQLDTFREKVNAFLDEHTIVNMYVSSMCKQNNRVRHEAWFLYQED